MSIEELKQEIATLRAEHDALMVGQDAASRERTIGIRASLDDLHHVVNNPDARLYVCALEIVRNYEQRRLDQLVANRA
jgi:hypothetical protein